MRLRRVSVFALGALGLTLFAARLARAAAPTSPTSGKRGSDYVWTIGLYAGATPLDLQPAPGAANPVFTAADTGDPEMDIVAHPFIAVERGRLHLFFTLKSTKAGTGVIGHADSADGLKWTYRGIVLREPAVLSYPCVFKAESTHYMIPESSDNVLRLYRATEFPAKWEMKAELVKGDKLVSPTILQHEGHWWLFVGAGNATLRLFHSDAPEGPWTEHAGSPIVANDANIARPAGRPFIVDGKLYRLAQDCEPTYGHHVVGFEITTLSRTEYRERPIEKSFVSASGAGWNAAAMHHIDAHRVAGDHWLAAVDARGAPVARSTR
jgi:hypothetical protein